MAYLREITRKCDRCHTANAIFELLTFRNERYGHYCRRCSGPMLKKVQADEQKYHANQAARR
jgi:late competence protein required for DNA uptake (superfamily II DNA/RNA helicase)